MAVRRLARQGLLLSEHPCTPAAPLAAPCPSCRRSLSSALQLNPARSDSNIHSQSLSKHASTGWAALSKAGQALFTPQEGVQGDIAGAVELSGPALDLVNQLKLSRKDPRALWDLFEQVEAQGLTHTLPLITLHALLTSIHSKPSSRGTLLKLEGATRVISGYNTKIDLIRTRIRQAGGSTTPGDWQAMLAQYHSFRHAPAASKTWDEMVDAGFVPKLATAKLVLETFSGWIELHGRAMGLAAQRKTAEPLVARAVAILSDVAEAGKRVDQHAVELLLKIANQAGDLSAFAKAVKTFYGFDVKLPGAPVALADGSVPSFQVDEAAVSLMLEAFAEQDDLPAMISIFETFDRPSAPTSSTSSFFTQSFSATSAPSDASTSTSSSSTLSPSASSSSEKPHPIGTRAFTTLIQAASRLGNGVVVRHYFDLLFKRWELSQEERLAAFESALGIVDAKAETSEARAEREAKEEAEEAAIQQIDELSEDGVPHRSFSIVSQAGVHLVPPPAAPAKPYVVTSTLVAQVANYTIGQYDAATARWIRARTRRIVTLMQRHKWRLIELVDTLSSPSTSPSSSSAVSPSLSALRHDLALVCFHIAQLRLTYASVKRDSSIVTSYTSLHHHLTSLSFKSQHVQSLAHNKKEQLKARPGLRAKERRVLVQRIILVRHRLNKLREVEKQGPGRYEYDKYAAELRVLKSKLEGTGWTELGEQGEVLGVMPHVEALQLPTVKV
ncbi:hypothetical protein JCM8097_004182 [Rhodosporidiobolus ruineniae]